MLSIHLSNFSFDVNGAEMPGEDGKPIPVKILTCFEPNSGIQANLVFTDEAAQALTKAFSGGLVVAQPGEVPGK